METSGDSRNQFDLTHWWFDQWSLEIESVVKMRPLSMTRMAINVKSERVVLQRFSEFSEAVRTSCCRVRSCPSPPSDVWNTGATDGTRTRHPDLGKVVLYQMSYGRIVGWSPRRKSDPHQIFTKDLSAPARRGHGAVSGNQTRPKKVYRTLYRFSGDGTNGAPGENQTHPGRFTKPSSDSAAGASAYWSQLGVSLKSENRSSLVSFLTVLYVNTTTDMPVLPEPV